LLGREVVFKPEYILNLLEPLLEGDLVVNELPDSHILPSNLILQNLDNGVLLIHHFLQVNTQRIEAIMVALDDLFLVDQQAAQFTRMRPRAPLLLMIQHFNSLHHLLAVNASLLNVRTDHLMLVKLLPNALRLAGLKGLALHSLVLAIRIVMLHLFISQHFIAAEVVVRTLELHRAQLLLDFLLYRDKARLCAHHWALASLATELVQTALVESAFALLALHGVDQDGVAEGA
jgi:hypothetical protein